MTTYTTKSGTEYTLDLSWRGDCDAKEIGWVSDDAQGWMDGGPIDQSRSVESQMQDWAEEMDKNGCDGSGRIVLR